MNTASGAVSTVCEQAMNWPGAFLGSIIVVAVAWFLVTLIKNI